MSLEIIPAIDLRGGQAVRLRRGDFDTTEQVADDPIAVAQSFQDGGAPRLHIVDLDGARSGVPHNTATIEAIIRKVTIPVQVGGGIRSLEIARQVLELGANRVIIGTAAATDADLVAAILSELGERVIIGADTSAGFIAVRGWEEKTTENASDFGKRLVALGARRFLFTDIARDGMLQGTNREATVAFAKAVGVPVLASGGVSGIEDIEKLAVLQPEGIEGVIVGKALYAGRLSLSDALRAANQM